MSSKAPSRSRLVLALSAGFLGLTMSPDGSTSIEDAPAAAPIPASADALREEGSTFAEVADVLSSGLNSIAVREAAAAKVRYSCTCTLLDDDTKQPKGKWVRKICASGPRRAKFFANLACEAETSGVDCKCSCTSTKQACQ